MTDKILDNPPQVKDPTRRRFLGTAAKVGAGVLAAATVGKALQACAPQPNSEPITTRDVPPEIHPPRDPNDFIVYGKEMENKDGGIWQAKIGPGGLIKTIEEATDSRWENWKGKDAGLSATIILPNNQMIEFCGANGIGIHGIDTFAEIGNDTSPVFDPVRRFIKDNPQFDINHLPPGSIVVFGKSNLVEQNSTQLHGVLGVDFYLQATNSLNPPSSDSPNQRLQIRTIKRTGPSEFKTLPDGDPRQVIVDASRLDKQVNGLSYRASPWVKTPQGLR